VGEAARVDPDLPLRDGAVVVLVQELDGRLDRHDVTTTGRVFVQMVHERGDRARAPRALHSRDEHQPEIAEQCLPHLHRESQRRERGENIRNDAHDDRKTGALAQNADAKSRDAGGAPGSCVVADFVDRRRVVGRPEDVGDHLVGADGLEDGRIERRQLSGHPRIDHIASPDMDVRGAALDRVDQAEAELLDLGRGHLRAEPARITRSAGSARGAAGRVGTARARQ